MLMAACVQASAQHSADGHWCRVSCQPVICHSLCVIMLMLVDLTS